MPYGRILKIFYNKLKKQAFLRILIFYAVDAPEAILGSPIAHEVEVQISEYPYPHPPPVKGEGVQLLLLKIGKHI